MYKFLLHRKKLLPLTLLTLCKLLLTCDLCVFVCMCCCRIPGKSHVADLPIDLKVNDDDDIKQSSITYLV